METIYKNNLNNVYDDILNSINPKLEYEGWKLYLNKRHDINLKDFEEIYIDDENTSKKRNANFREGVFNLYEHKCLFCSRKHGLEAAHLFDHNKSYIDDPYNGIILCKNHHNDFDEHRIKILKDNNKYYLKVLHMDSDSEEDIDLKKINNKELSQLEKYPIVNRYLTYRYKN
jgi:predicted restriction endonuclease